MFRRIKEYFKRSDRLKIQQDFYAAVFLAGGVISIVYLIGMAVMK